MPIKLLLVEGVWGFLEGGSGSADFISMGVGILPIKGLRKTRREKLLAKWPLRLQPHPPLKLQESPGPSRPGIPKESPESLPRPPGPGFKRRPKQSQNSLERAGLQLLNCKLKLPSGRYRATRGHRRDSIA